EPHDVPAKAQATRAATSEPGPHLRPRAVDGVGDLLLHAAQDRLLLAPRQLAGRHGGVEILLRLVVERLDEAVDGLVLRLGDVGQRLTALELRAKLRLGQTEVVRRSTQADDMPEVAEDPGAAAKPAESKEAG